MIYFETRKEYLKWNTGSSLLQLIDDSVEIILPSAAAKQYMQSMAGISEYEWKKTSTAFKECAAAGENVTSLLHKSNTEKTLHDNTQHARESRESL
jgi:hypothetical protein